ncbi:unnamed protein product [Mytilus coruscus]|uniref:Reverse transcriptase/retrotransposon-derived protein RNase H-like domain-containing protein n=1 Tax=Mytilus coruscus TaxID=42192 RepID=A0A6J8AKN8_MYTCO|nr:unnamed protein product [Mytilus coruscus]
MITLVSSSLISNIQENCESVLLNGIGPQPVIGKLVTNTTISIGQATMHWDVCVIDMNDTIILGLDFLNACSAVVDLVHMSVVLNGESIPAQLVGGNCQSLSEVLLSRSVKVPPNSSMLITVEVKSPPGDHYVILPKRNHLPVLISNVMGTGPKCIVNIVNDTGLHVRIKKGSCLGYAEPVDEIIDNNSFVKDTYNINQVHLSLANSYDQEDKPSDMPLPGHLHDCSTTNLKDDQMSTLRSLLIEFEDLAHQKGQPVWEDCREEAFLNIKELLTLPPCLAYPNPHDLFVLDTDASDIAIGAVLSQLQNDQEKVICYAGHNETSEEVLYNSHYLLGRRFVLKTDHNSLVWLMRFKHIEGQLARWLEELAQFDMEIVHRPGKKHLNADGLSRIPDCLEDCDCYNAGAEVENLPCKGCQYCQRAHTQWSRFLNDVDDVIPLAKRQVSPLEVKIAIVEENQTTQSEESFNSSIQGLKASSFSVADSNEHDMTEPNIEGDAIYTNWMQNYSPHHLRQLQLQDSDLFPLIEWIESQYDHSDAEPSYRSSMVTRFLFRSN